MAARVEPKKEEREAEAPPTPVRAYLLVADDDHTEAELMRERLRENLIMADLVHNAEDAVRAFSVRDYDLIVMNLYSPLRAGLDAAQTIRAKERHFPEPRVPIMMFSAGASESERRNAKDLGIDDVIVRPKDAAALLEMVQSKVEYERRTPSSSISREPVSYPALLKSCGRDEARAQVLLQQFSEQLQVTVGEVRLALEAKDVDKAKRTGEHLRHLAIQMASGRIQRSAVLLVKLSGPGQLRDRGPELVQELEAHARDLTIWIEMNLGRQVTSATPAHRGQIKTHLVKIPNFLKKRSDIFSKAP